jgi:hypothetical protein
MTLTFPAGADIQETRGKTHPFGGTEALVSRVQFMVEEDFGRNSKPHQINAFECHIFLIDSVYRSTNMVNESMLHKQG